MISTDNDAVHNVVGRGRYQKYRKFKVHDKTRGVGAIYHKRVNPNIETLAAANVSIFGITLVAAANVSKYGNISSCYHPQPWELRHLVEWSAGSVNVVITVLHFTQIVFGLLFELYDTTCTSFHDTPLSPDSCANGPIASA